MFVLPPLGLWVKNAFSSNEIADSGRYFSFPSFDTWEVDPAEKDDAEVKSP